MLPNLFVEAGQGGLGGQQLRQALADLGLAGRQNHEKEAWAAWAGFPCSRSLLAPHRLFMKSFGSPLLQGWPLVLLSLQGPVS